MSSEGRDEVKLGSVRDQVSSWTAGDFDDKKMSTKSVSRTGPQPSTSKRLIGPQRPVSTCTTGHVHSLDCIDQQTTLQAHTHICIYTCLSPTHTHTHTCVISDYIAKESTSFPYKRHVHVYYIITCSNYSIR